MAALHRLHGYSFAVQGPPDGPSMVLLHGMLGDVDNWDAMMPVLANAGYRVVVPLLPVYTADLEETSVEGLTKYVLGFLDALGGGPHVLVGNSLGGHVAICVALERPADVRALVLSGASGLYEVNIGTSTPHRFDRSFVQDRTAFTFHDPIHATDALVDRMMAVLADRHRLVRLVKMARSARDTYVGSRLHELTMPVLLVWGRQDRITPPDVAEQFQILLPDSTIVHIDECGHAPMIERPDDFNRHLFTFLKARVRAGVYAA